MRTTGLLVAALARVAVVLLALLPEGGAVRSVWERGPVFQRLHQHRHKASTPLESAYPYLHLGRRSSLRGGSAARGAQVVRQEEDWRALEAFYGRSDQLESELPGPLEEMKKQAEQAHEDLQNMLPSALKKPVMGKINIIRTQMCWNRPNLPEHTKCLKFLGLVCSQESTGEGICTKFRKLVKDSCKDGGAGVDQETMCSVKKKLGEEDEDEEEKEEEKKEGQEEEDKEKVQEQAEMKSAEQAVDVIEVEKEDEEKEEAKDEDADADGDGVVDSKDAFPKDPLEWADSDGDGVGDNSDAYPNDPSRWTKEGAEGNGTAAGEGNGTAEGGTAGDRDGDGVPDAEDAFPDDKAESKDTDGDGIGDNADPDLDGDGKPNEEDKFPLDKNEWGDLDGDGVGDNSDPDVDGDGHPNEKDKFPKDPNEFGDLDGDGVGDNSDPDIDGDGQNNENDAFPKDSKESLDSDGDGVGDNADAYPFNPNCHSPTEPCDSSDGSVETDPWKGGPITDPGALNKVLRHLPAQGFKGKPVRHEDQDTMTGDWVKEWPSREETEFESIERICKEHPHSTWCERYHEHRQFAR